MSKYKGEKYEYVKNLLKKDDSETITSATKKMIKKYDISGVQEESVRKAISAMLVKEKKDLEVVNRVLIIGDLHAPFDLKGYLKHCINTYKEYNCNKVVFIGDIIDNHFSSYHETDADGMGGGKELDFAIKIIKKWYKAFPEADVIIGNHDRIISRKAQTGGIPTKWIRSYSEVLGTPNWNFTERVVIDGVQYIHGESGTARSKAKADLMPTVQGHLHPQMYVEWLVGAHFKIFGMQVGCGIDHEKYAFAYAKAGKKPAIGCGVVLSKHLAFNVPMNLD